MHVVMSEVNKFEQIAFFNLVALFLICNCLISHINIIDDPRSSTS